MPCKKVFLLWDIPKVWAESGQMKIAVGLSGGTDSLAALLILKSAGHEIIPFHARFLPSPDKSIEQRLKDICACSGLDLEIMDLASEFESRVVKPFIRDYLQGLTPNPCAVCNRRIKFGIIRKKAFSLGADYLATGHYAGLNPVQGSVLLGRGRDHTRDQSYFLSMVPVEVFQNTIFPLQNMTKVQAKTMLKNAGLEPPQRQESREICFISTNYRDFIASRAGSAPDAPGPVLNRQGRIIGRHAGLWKYTIGQRRGLGIAHEHPLYVLDKDLESNALIVAGQADLTSDTFLVKDLNMHCSPEYWPGQLLVQTRYRQKPEPAEVSVHDNCMQVRLAGPGQIPAPGQVAAVYTRQGHIMAAGIISRS
ncbi:MAG: tRNA 2-thiouridine(34) synthase MnmA [Desulfonatronovibrionaceae bacterium]